MSLHLEAVFRTGTDALDYNLSDSLIVETQDGVFVVTTTGYGGGLAVYSLRPDGRLGVQDSQLFPDALQGGVSGRIATGQINGETVIVFGGTDTDAFAYTLQPNGQIGALRRIEWDDIEQAAARDTPGAMQMLALYDGVPSLLVASQTPRSDLVSVQTAYGHAQDYVLSLDSATGQLLSHAVNGNGNMHAIATLGALDGLALAAPTAMEIANFGGRSFAVIGSATGSSISVIEVLPDGQMAPTQQVIDTGSTRFANVQDMALVQQDDHVFVLAIGSDHGVTVFRLLPDGHLVFVETVSDDLDGRLNTPSSISAVILGDTLHALIGTQSTGQMAHLHATLDNLGQAAISSTDDADRLAGGGRDDLLVAGSDADTLVGGAGDDILSSGPGRSWLTGGAGADVFVFRAESTVVTIADFQPGRDRLDLSDLPMLRNLDQLEIVSTATGAIIRFREVEIIVTSQDGAPLRPPDLFPNALFGPDSLFIIAGETEPVPEPGAPVDGLVLDGTNGADTLFGNIGPDTIYGNRGNDRLYGLGSDDLLIGAMGHDRLWGAAGADTLKGNAGNDRLYGGGGADQLRGGAGSDTMYGGAGRDIVRGGGGPDHIWGGKGKDSLAGNSGQDLIRGGGGRDLLQGQTGNDRLLGNAGHDRLFGNAGQDTLMGGAGKDRLAGGGGADSIFGGAGQDRIVGGQGDDLVAGGGGADTFVFRAGHEGFRIEDFSFGQGDRLVLGPDLWDGRLSVSDVLAEYASVTNGNIVLDFGNGDIITLENLGNIARLEDHILIV